MIDKDESSATLDLNQVRIPDELVFFEALTSKSTIGITPLGLSDEKVLIRLLQSGYHLHLICFANFGPDGVKGISVSQLRTTVRLQVFNYQLSETDSVMPLLSYLNGLINGATSTNNRRGITEWDPSC
jgi:hypothetical protein